MTIRVLAAFGTRTRWLASMLLLLVAVAIPAPVSAAPCDYVVQRGDTLGRIAARNGITVDAILQNNPSITNPDVIQIGQRLRLPNCTASGGTVAIIVPRGAPARSLPPPPADLSAPLWQRVHDATIGIRHPVEAPRFGGSGIVVGADGRTFLTAYHVISNPWTGEEARRVLVGPFGGWRYTADVIATAPRVDLALLRVNAPNFPGFNVAPVGRSGALEEGEALYTLSYPGREGNLVGGKGHFLMRLYSSRYDAPLFVTDAAANFGSSGGVAVNGRGEVVGIISAGILDRETLRNLGYADLNQATLVVPIDAGADLLRQAGLER